MQSILGRTFINQELTREVPFSELEKYEVVALYFSAAWCPPCNIFAQSLMDFYNEVNYPMKRFEVIQVSSDKDEQAFHAYFSKTPWLAIPFGDPRSKGLKRKFSVNGVPILFLLNSDGSLALPNARQDVLQEGPDCFERWTSLIN